MYTLDKKELNRIADGAKIYGGLDLQESKWELIEKAVVAAAGLVDSMRRSGVNSIEWKHKPDDDEITIGEFDDCVDRLFDECVCAEITENKKPADHKARKLWARVFQFCAEIEGLL